MASINGKLLRLLALVLLLCSTRAFAQATPRLSVDLSYGFGGHSESAGSTWYRGEANVHPRLAVAATIAQRSHLAALLSAEYVGQLGAGDAIDSCSIAPNGSCRRYFPRLQGAGLTIGGRSSVGAFTFGLGLGRVGGFRWNAVDVDVDYKLADHVGFLVAGRGAWRHGPDAQQIDFWPHSIGFRLKF